MRRPPNLLLALLPLSAACIRDVGPGPFMGDCAEPPSGIYTFGETGIGTCLSGPSDIEFFEQDGATWLAVTNADPFRNFASGSVLLIDWASIDLGKETNLVDEIGAYAVETDPFVGGIGYVADDLKKVLLVTGRLSEDSRTRSAEDEMFVFDVSDPTDPEPWSLGDSLTLRDDPQLVAVHDGFGRAYVANLTDHSISVLDTTEAPIVPIDVAPRVELGDETFDDSDASGSTAELSLVLDESDDVRNDLWTLDWVEASFRLWLPTEAGLHRWQTGGAGYIDSGSTNEIDPADSGLQITSVEDPSYTIEFGASQMTFASEGDLWWITQQASGVWAWETLGRVLGGGDEGEWDHVLGGPSALLTAAGTALIYYDGRATDDGDASIGLAVFDSSGFASGLGDPVLSPTAPYTSFEDPFLRTDLLSARYRMWLGMWDGTRWTIGLSESADTGTWTVPVEVLSDPAAQVAAPVVAYANGRYRMWFSLGDGTTWKVAETWSYDGVHWNDVTPVLEFAGTYDPRHPPRVAMLSDATGGWRVSSETRGILGTAFASGEFALQSDGFTMRVANGYEAGPTEVGDTADAGILPVSSLVWGGHDYVWVTAIDTSGRTSIAALERIGGDWVGVAEDLIPDKVGGNEEGAASPVVVPEGGGLVMYYAAAGNDGVDEIHRATSADGLVWTPAEIDVPAHGEWELMSRRPHSVEALTGGGIRLWYTGTDGATSRIGALTSTDGISFEVDPGELDDWQIGVGPVGKFDDSGVADPAIYVDGDTTHLWYAAFDGQVWAIGHSTRQAGETAWTRDEDVVTGAEVPKLFGVARTFSAAGVRSPVLRLTDDGGTITAEGLYGGFDGAVWRMGRGVGALSRIYPAQRFPTPGDQITFETRRGDPSGGVIELLQTFDGKVTSGLGVSAMTLDRDRGFLYLTAKPIGPPNPPNSYVYVLDVRDDTRDGFADRNYLDIEAVLEVGQSTYSSGFRDAVPVPGTDLLYASGQSPDGLVVFDLSLLVDDDRKDAIQDAALTALPLLRVPGGGNRPFQDEDAGTPSQARITGAGIAASPDGTRLYVAHFRDNSLIAYDLRLGAYGEEIRRTAFIGENPHLVRISPDGRYAVVANYLGDVDAENVVHSTLAIVDIDPASPDYMQVVTWIRDL